MRRPFRFMGQLVCKHTFEHFWPVMSFSTASPREANRRIFSEEKEEQTEGWGLLNSSRCEVCD
jgi:hypothetical protein